MDAARKSIEIQAKVRHNAEDFKNTLNDLYSWEKDIKDKEQKLQQNVTTEKDINHLKTLPVRSHIEEQPNNKKQQKQTKANSVVTNGNTNATEKSDENDERRKRANAIKDRGNAQIKLGEYDKAINAYTTAIDIYSEDPVFYSNRALCYLKIEKYQDCISDCTRAIKLDSAAVKAYYRRMLAHECLDDLAHALEDCKNILRIEPNNVEAQNSLQRIMDRIQNSASGGSVAEEVDHVTNDNSDIVQKHKQANEIKDIGNVYIKTSKYDLAIDAYTKAIDLYAEDSVYYTNRALCYLKLERYDECIQDCDRAIEIDKLAVKAYYRRMQANESLGNNMDALKDCTTVLMIEPKNAEAKKSLERINQRLRKTAQSSNGPNFSPLRSNMLDILPIEKPPYKRSKTPLRRVSITDVVGPKESKNHENTNLQISDEDIDKLFNSNCGPFIEIKNKNDSKPKSTTNAITNAVKIKTVTPVNAKIVETTKHTTENSNKIANKSEEKQEEKKYAEVKAIVDSNKISTIKTNAAVTPIDTDALHVNSKRPLPPAPTSTAQFYSNWNSLPAIQKYQYLKSIEISRLCKVLGAGLDSDTLTGVINTLRDFYLPNKEPTTASTLLEVSKNNQVAILSLMMSADDRKALAEILNAIKENTANVSTAELIVKNFKLY